MKKICKELMKKNNEREKEILKSNDEIYTDMIVYLRCSDITEYNQELVREDLINMIIDGQNRGDDIEKVMGGNYKEICDQIIESMPKKTAFQKFMSALQTTFTAAWVVGIIFIVKQMIINVATKEDEWNFVLNIQDIISIVLIIFLAQFIVKYICKNAFKKENKVKEFFKYWIMGIVYLLVLVGFGYFFNFTVIETSFFAAVILVAILFVLDKVFSYIVDEKVL